MKHSSDSLLVQGSILAIAGLLTKLLGFLYRIPMANMLGEQGNGIYSVAFGIYNIALTLSSYSLPAAVSKLISERLGRGDRPGVRLVFRTAVRFALLAGTCAAAVLFFGASGLETLYHRAGLARPLRVLAPTRLLWPFWVSCGDGFRDAAICCPRRSHRSWNRWSMPWSACLPHGNFSESTERARISPASVLPAEPWGPWQALRLR